MVFGVSQHNWCDADANTQSQERGSLMATKLASGAWVVKEGWIWVVGLRGRSRLGFLWDFEYGCTYMVNCYG